MSFLSPRLVSLRSWLLLAAASSALGLAAAPAHAAGQAVAVLGVDVGGQSPFDPHALAERTADSLRAGLASSGYQVADPARVAKVLGRNGALAGCYESDCLATLADFLQVDRFVHGRVDAFGQNFSITVDLYASDRPTALVYHLEQSCGACSIQKLQDTLTQAAATLRAHDVAPAAPTAQPVAVASTPPGARVTVDGKPAGTTPLTTSLAPGPHTVSFERPGYLPAERSVTVSNVPARVDVTLAPSGIAGETTTARPFRTWKWVAAGTAAATLATGIVLIAIDGEGTCSASPPAQCPRLYDTAATGYAMTGLGLALGAGATALFLFDRQGSSGTTSASVSAAILPQGGAAATLRVPF